MKNRNHVMYDEDPVFLFPENLAFGFF